MGALLRLALHLENVHPDVQSILEAVAVTNARVGDELSGPCVVDHLMDIGRAAAIGVLGEPSGSTVLEMAANCLFQ